MLTTPFEITQTGSLVEVVVPQRTLAGADLQELLGELAMRLRCNGAVYFILDMPTVEFISSSCLSELLNFLQELEHVRGRLALARCRPTVATLFHVTQLDVLFRLYDDLDTARTEIAQ